MRPFSNRIEAGRTLATLLGAYRSRADVMVLALPRGGVPVGFEVAAELRAPLDVFVVRKLGVPWHRELAMGAIASGGVRVLNDDVIGSMHVPEEAVEQSAKVEEQELARRERLYRGGRPFPSIEGQVAIVVDDGLATGSSMRAAVRALRQHRPSRIVVAVPVAAKDTCTELQAEVDEVVCALTPEPFYAVGLWYAEFEQTTDAEVRDLLAKSMHELVDRGT